MPLGTGFGSIGESAAGSRVPLRATTGDSEISNIASGARFPHTPRPMIRKLVARAGLIQELEASTKEAALQELLGVAQDVGAFPKTARKTLQKRLSDREAIGSTGLGNSVAVPHVKGEGVEEITLVVARCHPGIEWQAIDGRQVHVLFMLVSPMDDPESHLKCLRWIAGLARNTDFRRFLLDAEGEEAIRDLLVEMGGDGDEA